MTLLVKDSHGATHAHDIWVRLNSTLANLTTTTVKATVVMATIAATVKATVGLATIVLL